MYNLWSTCVGFEILSICCSVVDGIVAVLVFVVYAIDLWNQALLYVSLYAPPLLPTTASCTAYLCMCMCMWVCMHFTSFFRYMHHVFFFYTFWSLYNCMIGGIVIAIANAKLTNWNPCCSVSHSNCQPFSSYRLPLSLSLSLVPSAKYIFYSYAVHHISSNHRHLNCLFMYACCTIQCVDNNNRSKNTIIVPCSLRETCSHNCSYSFCPFRILNLQFNCKSKKWILRVVFELV